MSGWPLLARFMADHPIIEAFPRFREANIKNLLYYQVQISKLEKALKNEEHNDWERTKNLAKRQQLACFPNKMIDSGSEQWELVLGLRKCLHQYSEINSSPYLLMLLHFLTPPGNRQGPARISPGLGASRAQQRQHETARQMAKGRGGR